MEQRKKQINHSLTFRPTWYGSQCWVNAGQVSTTLAQHNFWCELCYVFKSGRNCGKNGVNVKLCPQSIIGMVMGSVHILAKQVNSWLSKWTVTAVCLYHCPVAQLRPWSQKSVVIRFAMVCMPETNVVDWWQYISREVGMCPCGDNHCHVYTSTEGRKLSCPRHFKMRNGLCRLLFSSKQILPWHT